MEGLDSSEDQQKWRGTAIAVLLAPQTDTIVVLRHFCLVFLLSSDPKRLCVGVIPNQFPTLFGNGQFVYVFLFYPGDGYFLDTTEVSVQITDVNDNPPVFVRSFFTGGEARQLPPLCAFSVSDWTPNFPLAHPTFVVYINQ